MVRKKRLFFADYGVYTISLFAMIISIINLLILSVSFASASLTIGNYSLDKTYSKGDYLRGWVNISVSDENSDALITSNYGSSIKLIDFLNIINAKKSCVPINCQTAYSASAPSTSKTFVLDSINNKEKIIGFKLTGLLDSNPINSAKFTMNSNAQASCFNQIKVDILNDDVVDMGNNNSASASCLNTKSYGCFNENEVTELYILNTACQKINLSESPAFEVGAWIKREKGQSPVKMELFTTDNYRSLGRCELPITLNEGGEGEFSCTINHLATKNKEYYVCINAESNSDIRYKIKGYTPSNSQGCGFTGIPSLSTTNNPMLSFKIFATGKQFGNVGTIKIEGELPNNVIFSRMIQDYIENQYGINRNCTNGCIVPIKFKGAMIQNEQQITLTNGEILYKKSGATTSTEDFYDISSASSKITSNFQRLYLDYLNLSLPSEYGNYTFTLSLGNNKIFSEKITIVQAPVIYSLTPLLVPAAVERTFYLNATSPNNLNLTKYIWDFGNGDKKTTAKNIILYKYNTTGNFILTATVVDEKNMNSSKRFNIASEKPDKIANNTLNKKLEQLKELNENVKVYPEFAKRKINNQLNLSETEDELKAIKRSYESASSDEDYVNVVNRLSDVDLPFSIYSSEKDDSNLVILNIENVDLNVLNEIGSDLDSDIAEEDYLNAINVWYIDNIETKISYDKVSAFYDDRNETLVNVITLNVKKKSPDLSDEVYLIMKDFKDIEFKEAYNEKRALNDIYIKITEPQQDISFSTTEEIDFYDIDAYVTTRLKNLNVSAPGKPLCVKDNKCEKDNGENWRNCFSDCKPYGLISWIITGLLLFFFVIYIITQEWYKRRYENYLFTNRNYLFNILNYVHQEKIKGTDDSIISKSLKKSGWNNEQIRYAIRKYYGKRTGMFEIPMDWLLNIFRKKTMPHYDKRIVGTVQPNLQYKRY